MSAAAGCHGHPRRRPLQRRSDPAPGHAAFRSAGNLVTSNVFNARVEGANVTTIELMMNIVAIGSAANSQLQTILHTTFNPNGEMTTQFQNFHVHCQAD